MCDLIERNGVSYAKDFYGTNGDKVIDVYKAQKAMGKSKSVGMTEEPQIPLSLSALEFVTPTYTDLRAIIAVRGLSTDAHQCQA
jgi:hypothetical protein